jgi:hypothetical protein
MLANISFRIPEKKGVVGGDMAKIDVARFMVDQAVNPTFHKISKTVGAEPGTTIWLRSRDAFPTKYP